MRLRAAELCFPSNDSFNESITRNFATMNHSRTFAETMLLLLEYLTPTSKIIHASLWIYYPGTPCVAMDLLPRDQGSKVFTLWKEFLVVTFGGRNN